MILETEYYEGDPGPQVVGNDPDDATIAETVRSVDWGRFAFVTLRRDDENWINGSGCLEPDTGLTIMLSHNGIQYVTETAPTVETIIDALCAYRHGDEQRLFSIIYHVPGRKLTSEMIESLRQEEVETQRRRQLDSVLAEAAELFRNKDAGRAVRVAAGVDGRQETPVGAQESGPGMTPGNGPPAAKGA